MAALLLVVIRDFLGNKYFPAVNRLSNGVTGKGIGLYPCW